MTSPVAVLAVIPARGGSKGLANKNLQPLMGLPLIGHAIRCAQHSPSISRIVVSTDSDQIAGVATELGADVPFKRPAELATDTAAMWPVIRHALVETEAKDGRQYDLVVLLDPTSPGRLPSDVESGVTALLGDPTADGVIGVSEPEFSPYWHCVVERDGYMQDLFPEARHFARRQDVPPVFRINASLYIWRRKHVLESADWRTGRLLLHVIPDNRAIHIDDADQLQRVTLLFEHGVISLPWVART